MIIRVQDESAIYDFEKSFCVYATENGEVYLMGYTGERAYLLGTYKNEERAKEVIKEIFALCDCQSRYDMPIV